MVKLFASDLFAPANNETADGFRAFLETSRKRKLEQWKRKFIAADELKIGSCAASNGSEPPGSGLSHAHHMAWRAILQGHAALVERIGREVNASGGVSLDSYDVMLALSNAPVGRLKMGELACHVVLSRSGLTRLMDRMEANGWVARELAADDRRSFEAFLTPQGQAAFKTTWPLYARAIAQALTPLSDDEAQQLAELLDRVRGGEN